MSAFTPVERAKSRSVSASSFSGGHAFVPAVRRGVFFRGRFLGYLSVLLELVRLQTVGIAWSWQILRINDSSDDEVVRFDIACVRHLRN